jgi:hypothetical protein
MEFSILSIAKQFDAAGIDPKKVQPEAALLMVELKNLKEKGFSGQELDQKIEAYEKSGDYQALKNYHQAHRSYRLIMDGF